MSNVYLIGDTHFGHKNIAKFRDDFESEEHHRAHLIERWHKVITKNDLVWVLGDAAFTVDGLESFRALPGRKILVRGNHDELPVQMYLSVFQEVYGITRYKKSWLTHCPIHPDELRGRSNVHGHVHWQTIPDKRYINVSAEVIGYTPINYRALEMESSK